MRIAIAAGLLAATATVATTAIAQQQMEDVTIETQRVADNVVVLFGRGGNIALHHGADGNILVDDQYAPLTPKILATVRELSGEDVRFVLNTHYHADHSGGNENLAETGALIMAHENVRTRIAERIANSDSEGEGALPVLTFESGIDLYWNGEQVGIDHVHHAHTDGDSIVSIREAKVVHMGDTYFNKVTWPFIDLGAGGSIDGVIGSAKRVLDMADNDWQIIPGHGPVASYADLQQYHAMLVAIRNGVEEGIAAGETLEQVQARGLTDGYGVEEGFISAPKFIEAVYKSLQGDTDYSPR